GREDAVDDEIGHLRRVRGPVHVELRNAARALVPARHQEPDVIEAMVVVQVREEDVGHLRRLHSRLEQPVAGARAEVEEDLAAAGLDQVPGAHALERRRGCASTEETDAHYCGSMPSSLASLPNCSISLRITFVNSSGALP